MSFLNSLDITGSALTAERFRMDIISQNLSNIDNTMTADGTPYRRKQVVFQERGMNFQQALQSESLKLKNGGVRVTQVVENPEDFVPVYNPTHPHANAEGYVMMPNVDRAEETVDLMAASNAYSANITALNIVKAMTMKALEIGK